MTPFWSDAGVTDPLLSIATAGADAADGDTVTVDGADSGLMSPFASVPVAVAVLVTLLFATS